MEEDSVDTSYEDSSGSDDKHDPHLSGDEMPKPGGFTDGQEYSKQGNSSEYSLNGEAVGDEVSLDRSLYCCSLWLAGILLVRYCHDQAAGDVLLQHPELST